MAYEVMQQMIGRALTDRKFREDLLRSPREATHDMPLTAQERELIASVRATSLDEFSYKLNDQLAGRRERRRCQEHGTEAA